MENINSNFWIWLGVIGALGGFGFVTLLRAYLGRGGQVCLFPEPLSLVEPLDPANPNTPIIQTALTKAATAFVAGRYRWAIDQYSLAVQTQPDLAVAYQNRGLAAANLGQFQEAAPDLAKAAQLYLDQDNPAAAQQVYAQLQTLKSKR